MYMLITLVALAIQIHGTCEYTERGVRWAGFEYAWIEVEELDERAGDAELVRVGFEEWSDRLPEGEDGLDARVQLAAWCARNGLAEEAQACLEQVLEQEPNHAAARRSRGEVLQEGEWRPATQYIEARRGTLPAGELQALLALADECHDLGLRETEWELISGAAAELPDHDEVLGRLRRHLLLQPRELDTLLAGRWRICPPTHDRLETLFAVELESVDPEGRLSMRPGLRQNYTWQQPILAAGPGVVVEVRDSLPDLDLGQAQADPELNLVRVRDDDGYTLSYLNLRKDSAEVAPGDRVEAGQLLALVGHQGLAETPRLRFQVTRPLSAEEGGPGHVGVPFLWRDFRLTEVRGEACRVTVGAARPQVGWHIQVARK